MKKKGAKRGRPPLRRMSGDSKEELVKIDLEEVKKIDPDELKLESVTTALK
jgi:hypothetical protein